ncbi:unnamed protein product [Gemmata massiliana]|uniref:N-acetyltransferase domain-containing protein n=1 Tax=Gemmata massiliana TaxID=1210884 RepID=A0A6P2D9H9_9BACT|nr:GNAT family N-acetyltransferase [Gemmata massiliana]VTR97015.1 unnamed protein product [Gemmata massiliana]
MPTLLNGIHLSNQIQLLVCESGQTCSANICELTRNIAKHRIDLAWWTELQLPRHIRQAQRDAGWCWVDLRGELQHSFGRNGYGWCACTEDGDCQGAILYQVGGVSSFDESLPTVFCHRLATAPRNREGLVPQERYRGVGKGLIALAALHSYRAGLAGRVTVETYDDPDVREWYKRLGFRQTPKDSDGIVDFELVPEAANSLLANLLV